MTVAVGFSPRTRQRHGPESRQRRLTGTHDGSSSSVAPRRGSGPRWFRGLKPTATVIASLRDGDQGGGATPPHQGGAVLLLSPLIAPLRDANNGATPNDATGSLDVSRVLCLVSRQPRGASPDLCRKTILNR